MKDTIKLGAPVRMIAHRGVCGLERENTCAAFVAAGNRSYYGVETDVHRTADGKFIIIHDDTTERVTGISCTVEETDFDTLRALRAMDLEGVTRGDLQFPSLEEYIRICKKYDKEAVLELKNHFEPKDIEAIIAVIREIGWLERTTFISFDLPNMLCIREKLPQQSAQYLVCELNDEVLEILKKYHLDLDIEYHSITAEQVKACHDAGILVNVWTVNDPEDGKRLAQYGVDFITSNILE